MIDRSGDSALEQAHVKAAGITWQRLEDQLSWYDGKSVQAQRTYKWVKLVEIIAASVVPVSAGSGMPPALTGALGALIVVLEGFQHLSQWHQNWILYRSTAESLKHEKYLFLAKAGPYSGADSAQVLAERVEALISREHSKWTEVREVHEKKAAASSGRVTGS